ncbi:MAG: FHA domain-containing protein [Chloroflexota bacterium]|nr:FHA domain-containing protein [Chloroflexota bacterium]
MQQDDRPTMNAGQMGSSGETARVGETVPPTYPTQPVDTFAAQPGPGQQTQVLSQPPPTFAWLAALNGIRSGRLFPLDARGTTIGRDAQNDIVLDDMAVSRQHAKLRREPGARRNVEQFYVYDLGTANGTFVNDQKVVRKALNDGDRVRIGETLLVFKTVESAPTAARKAKRAKRASKAKSKKK